MGFKEIAVPHGNIKLVLSPHFSDADIAAAEKNFPTDRNGMTAGYFNTFKKPEPFGKNDLLMLELESELPPNVDAQPDRQREQFMQNRIAPAIAENANQILRDHASGNTGYFTDFHRQIAEKKPTLAFIDVVGRSEMGRVEKEAFKQRDANGWLIQLASLGAAYLPWLKKPEKGKQPSKKVKNKAIPSPKYTRRQFLWRLAASFGVVSLGGVAGSLAKENSIIHRQINKDISEAGPIEGFRELERKIVNQRTTGPAIDLRNAAVASKALALMESEQQRTGKKQNAQIYFGTGHTAMFENLNDANVRSSMLRSYGSTMHRFIDPALSENVIVLRYDEKLGEYRPEVIKLHGALNP